MTDWSSVKNFKSTEFDDPTLKGSGVNMDAAFIARLDALRDAVGSPLTILSGYRTEAHNATVGGVDGSAHTSGHAADIAALGSGSRAKILRAAFQVGFNRVGIGTGFIHVDSDPTKPPDVVWLYPPTASRV